MNDEEDDVDDMLDFDMGYGAAMGYGARNIKAVDSVRIINTIREVVQQVSIALIPMSIICAYWSLVCVLL